MIKSLRDLMISMIMILTVTSPLISFGDRADAYSNPHLFTEAVDIQYDTDLKSELTLDAENARDVYRIMDLKGDENNYGENAHRFIIGVIKDDGSNIKATFYEPNGRPIGTMYSTGQRSEIEFYIPYNGNYFFEVMADPEGSSAEYSYQMGGQENSNNNLFDGNNYPGSTGFSGGDLGGELHPTHDIVDYIQVDIPPFHSMESVLKAVTDLKLDILNRTENLIEQTLPFEQYRITNDGGDELRLFFRVFMPLVGNELYPPSSSSYELEVMIWSHTTIPQINESDPWPNTIVINEDHDLEPPINLSTHFIETMGDKLDFSITSDHRGLDVWIENYTIGKGESAWNYSLLYISPHHNWAGEEIVSLKARDRDGEVTDSFKVSVREINDLPYINRIGGSFYEGGPFNMYALEDEIRVYKINYSDDDDPHENLFFTTNASSEIITFVDVHSNGTIVISPEQKHVGSYSFNITLNDGRGGTFTVNILLSVEPVNDRPDIPSIEIVKGNTTLLPGEEITLLAINVNDIDGDELTVTWDWGDGRTSKGNPVSHIYSTSHSGNTTITVTVMDEFLSSSSNITIYVEAPEDVAVGNLMENIKDDEGDAVKVQEEWRDNDQDNKVLTVSTVRTSGLDILSIRSQRKGNILLVFLDIRDTIQIDGSFHYHLYIMKSGYLEPFTDFRNISDWESIPDRTPDDSMVITERKYVGDPNLHNQSTGKIMNKATLVWTIPFNELVEGGLEYPIDTGDYQLFAVSYHILNYAESGLLSHRYIITDTAGEGALKVNTITPMDDSRGDSSSGFGDFAKPTNILVVAGIMTVLVIFGVAGFVLVYRQNKEKKQQEKEFVDHINRLRDEGKDPFGKDLEKEDKGKDISYESLYGTEIPKGYDMESRPETGSTLPGPGLGNVVKPESHIEEIDIDREKS